MASINKYKLILLQILNFNSIFGVRLPLDLEVINVLKSVASSPKGGLKSKMQMKFHI